MTTIAELSETIQELLTKTAEETGKETGFIRRKRQVSGAKFAQSLVLGWMGNVSATRQELHQTAVKSGIEITPQGLDKRFNAQAVAFMQSLLSKALNKVVNSETAKPLLSRFNGVYLTDCSQVEIVTQRHKLAVRLELQRGNLSVFLEEGQRHDQKTKAIDQPLPAGAVHMGDLGFFNLKRFQAWNEQGILWLSRLKVGTVLYDEQGNPLDLHNLLQNAPTDTISLAVRLGKQKQVGAFLVAQRVSPEVHAKRLAQFKELRRRQHPVSATKEALAYWTIYITNIDDLTFEQAHILARTRWQIELLFKLWKSHLGLGHSRSQDPFRQRCEFYAKLIAVLISHWTLLVTGWQHIALSHVQALRLIRTYAHALLRALPVLHSISTVLSDIQYVLVQTARLTSRKKVPLAFQFWLDFDGLSA